MKRTSTDLLVGQFHEYTTIGLSDLQNSTSVAQYDEMSLALCQSLNRVFS